MKKLLILSIFIVLLSFFSMNLVIGAIASYNFSDQNNIWSYDCDFLTDSGFPDSPPPNTKPPGCFPSRTSKTTDSDLDSSDNIRELVGSTTGDTGYVHIFFNASIQENVNAITNLTWYFEGNEWGSGTIYLYLYNYTSSSYVQFSTIIGTTDITRLLSTTAISNFVDPSNGETFMVAHYSGSGSNERFYVDYAALEIEHDAEPPDISIVTPTNNTNTTDNTLDVNFTRSDTELGLDTCWYSNDTMSVNTTLENCGNLTDITWADGQHNVTIWANDSANNVNSSSISFTVDTTSPSINILYPTDYQSFTSQIGINVNFTRSDAVVGLDSCWWSNSSGVVNISIADPSADNITVTESGSGTYKVDVWCNDSLNNLGTDSINYVVSTDAPAITINYPTNGLWIPTGTIINFNVTATDTNGLNNCSLWGNWTGTWHLNQTNYTTITSGTLFNFTQSISDGWYKFNFECYDTTGSGSWGGGNFTFGVDTIYPSINLTYPNVNNHTSIQTILNYSYNDTNTDSCWYSANNGNTNTTITCGTNLTGLASVQGSSTWISYSNDSAGNTNQSTFSFFVDSIYPSVNISANFSNSSFLNYNTTISLNITINDTNIKNCTYNINHGSNVTIGCGLNLTSNFSEGSNTIYLLVNDTMGNLNNTESYSFIVDTTYPEVNITNVTTTAGSQTFTFDFNVTEKNVGTCFYTVTNSTGGVDSSITANSSVTCNSTGNSETVSLTSGDFNLTVYSNDSAGNLNYTIESFAISELSVPPGGGGGGGGPASNVTIIVLRNVTWTMETEQEGDFYELEMAALSKRTKDLIFRNSGTEPVTLDLSCEGDLCDFLEFETTNVTLPVGVNVKTLVSITLSIPREIESRTYVGNVIGTERGRPENKKIITLKVRVGGLGYISGNIDKLSSSKRIGGVPIPYAIIFAFMISIISVFTYFIILKKIAGGKALSIVFGFVSSFILLTFI